MGGIGDLSSEQEPVPAGSDAALLRARAAVVHDLGAAGLDSPAAVDLVEDAVVARRWWVAQWPGGTPLIAGQVAQDVQDRLFDTGVQWPLCEAPDCDGRPPHSLALSPPMGPDPTWVCEEAGTRIAPLGRLPHQLPAAPGPLD